MLGILQTWGGLDGEVAAAAGTAELAFECFETIAIPGGGCVLRNSQNFADFCKRLLTPDFHDDDFGEFRWQLFEAGFKLVAGFVARGIGFKPRVERLRQIGFLIGDDAILAAFAAVIAAAQVDGEAADGGVEVRHPEFAAADEVTGIEFFDKFDQGVLQDVLGVLVGAGLLAGKEQQFGALGH